MSKRKGFCVIEQGDLERARETLLLNSHATFDDITVGANSVDDQALILVAKFQHLVNRNIPQGAVGVFTSLLKIYSFTECSLAMNDSFGKYVVYDDNKK